ncbi:hypothetical protein KI387_011190, partial [Taxus chinensis]
NRLGCDSPTPIAQLVEDSGIAFATGFPISVQCADTVFACGACFNLESKEILNAHGKVVARLDSEAISTALRIPTIEGAN